MPSSGYGPNNGPSGVHDDVTSSFKFVKLNSSNYNLWSEYMKASLQAKYLWLIVSGDEEAPSKPLKEKPESTSGPDWKNLKKEYWDWLLKDQAAQGLLKGSAESTQWAHLGKADTSMAMWNAWEELYITM
ncbi:hypothetical protein K439DRAFT_1615554 [Ramaria rubella]|nr:hypothetical protein K439DRAFT_1615554 [Ramaria rubella]